MSLSAHTQTHTTQIKSCFPSEINVITSLETDRRSEVLPTCKPSLPHSPTSLALSHKAKARVRSPLIQYNPGCISWDQQEEEMGAASAAQIRMGREWDGEVSIYEL